MLGATRSRLRFWPWVLLVTAACLPVGRPRPSPAPVTYVLEWSASSGTWPKPRPDACSVLAVAVPRAAPGFDSTGIAYVTQPYKLDYYADHRWADTPANMLTPLLVRSMSTSILFNSVLQAPTTVRTSLTLDSEVLSLQHVFQDHTSFVELSMRVVLTSPNPSCAPATRSFLIDEPAPGNNPYGAVVAANRAVAKFFVELMVFLDSSMQGCLAACP